MRDSLHTLIHSLSKSEKRYFRLFCTREISGENYLRLFDAIDGQKVYDEKAIKTRFRKAAFAGHLHVTKNYLRKLILKSLRNYHSDISTDAQLKDILRNVEILYNKELYALCSTELKRAATLAAKHELLNGRVEVETWNRKLAQAQQPNAYERFSKILHTQKEAIDALQSTNMHWRIAVDISSNLFSPKNNIGVRNVALKNPDNAQTLETKVLFYNTQYLLDIRNEDNDSAERRLIALIELLEASSERIEEEPGLYVSSINNLLSFYVFQKRHTDALHLIRKAKSVYDEWKITAANRTLLKQILRTYNIELEICRDTKAFITQPGIVPATERFITDNVQKIPKDYLISFWFQLARIHFMRKAYGDALEWINRILNAKFRGVRSDLHVHAQLLNLMIHLDQQNLMVLRYYVDSTRRYMKKIQYREPYAEVLLKFFIKMGRLPLLEYRDAYRELKQSLFPEGKESLVPDEASGYIDLRTWIDEKLSGNHV